MINFIKGLWEVEGAKIYIAATINKTSYYLSNRIDSLGAADTFFKTTLMHKYYAYSLSHLAYVT